MKRCSFFDFLLGIIVGVIIGVPPVVAVALGGAGHVVVLEVVDASGALVPTPRSSLP